ncbi:major facilitator family transporter [Fusarium heterosporum]|uniref:Major facilitator family transporter n=1 Tax=Fusarium heterosporum TaxID=42747 RepID=A0A8H5STD8_FUSHE|nr:major facilitator family transporter [Fusarium heterosporum]
MLSRECHLRDLAQVDNVLPNDNPSPDPQNITEFTPAANESLQARIERLSRERPPIFTSRWSEIVFIFSISMSQFLTEYFVSGFTVILPTLTTELDIPQAAMVWPATAFSLVIASTLLVFGRLGDMWGGYPVFMWGLAWLLIWSIITGFSINPLMLDCCRALQGLGAAAILPTGVMLIGSLYRPGPRKNLVFAVYGTSAVFGFFGGILMAGIVGQFTRWGFYFWIGAILAAITMMTSVFSIPCPHTNDHSSSKTKMDYPGAITIVCGLILVVSSILQSAHAAAGWRTPYIPVCLGLGVSSLFAAGYIETRVSAQPLLPASIFTTPCMSPLLLALFLLYGTWGIFSVYGTLYFQNIMSASPLQVVAWYVPLGLAGLVISIIEGYILHLVPGRVLLIISGLGALGSQLLIALIPIGGSYWAWVFPAVIFSTVGIDLSTILMTVFVTTTFPTAQQGLAGSVINSVLQLGVAFILGLTDIIQSATEDEAGLGKSYKNTFWFGVGAAAASLVILAIWGKVPKASSDLTSDEKAELLDEIKSLVDEAASRFGGRLDVVISNVGWTQMRQFSDLDNNVDEDDWDRCYTANVKSHLWLFHAAKQYLEESNKREAGGAVFVSTASLAGVIPSGSSIPYAVTKAAQIHLGKCLATIAAPLIRVNTISPGILLTVSKHLCHLDRHHLILNQEWGLSFPAERLETARNKNKLGRFATVEDVAEQVRTFVVSKSVTGQNGIIDAGFGI